jgi:hypothetical protein
MKKSLFLLLFLWVYNTSTNAQCSGVCQPIAYDGFTYNANTAIHSQFGGAGWGGGWDVQNSNTTTPGYQSVAGSLAYSLLKTNANSFSGGQAYLLAGRNLDVSTTGAFAAFRNAQGRIGTGTLWTSLILQKVQNNNQSTFFAYHNSNTTWYSDPNQRVAVGYFGASSTVGGVRYWSLQVGGTVYNTSIPVTIGQDAFFVLKFNFSASPATVSLFLNPTILGSASEPATATLIQNLPASFDFKAVNAYLGDGAGNGRLDEIRFATTYQCASPDNSTAENLPPIASFTASANTGNAPFSVGFDASASSDPGGSIVSYQWSFADGGTATGVSPSYLFKHKGVVSAVLTVTDNCGLSSSTNVDIKVRDANGVLPCRSAISLSKLATCGQNNGQISISGNGTSTLIDTQNNSYTFSSGAFSNLPARAYTLTHTGTNGCMDTYNVQVGVDSSTCAGWSPKLKIGMGLEGLSYWELSRALREFMRTAAPFFSFYDGGPWNSNQAAQMPKDTAGYPTQIPFTVAGTPQKARIVISADGHLPTGSYVFLYDGQGTFNFSNGMSVVSSSAGRIVLNNTTTGNIWMDIHASTLGNHLRNFRLLRLSDETVDLEANPFYQPFLDKSCLFAAIRFMDWQHTNASPIANWADRKKTYEPQAGDSRGVAYEYMIKYANLLRKDIWVNVPHLASDDFITQMARMFRDRLDPQINVYIEYSNEVWNWQFEQAHWVNNNGPQHISYPRKYALRALNVFRIWHQEWGTQKHRVKRVAGTQSVNNWLGQQILSEMNGEFDYFSPTFYFGYKDSPTAYAALQAMGASATPIDVINATTTGWRNFAPSVRQNYRDAALYGKGIAHYEGGQHMTSNPTTEAFQTANYAAQIHPNIGVLYQEVLDSLKKWNTHLAMAFVLTGKRESIYGSWGHVEFVEQDPSAQPAPKYNTLIANMNSPVCPCVSVKTDTWNNAQAWSCGHPPTVSDETIIKTNHIINLNTPMGFGKNIKIDQGGVVLVNGVLQIGN